MEIGHNSNDEDIVYIQLSPVQFQKAKSAQIYQKYSESLFQEYRCTILEIGHRIYIECQC